MITEDYVSFEVAKLLKEKDFHEKVNHVYHYYTTAPFYQRHLRDFNGEDYNNLKHEHYSAPTQAMAMKWLREVHKVLIVIDAYHADHWEGYIDSFEINIYCHASTIIVPKEIVHHTDYEKAVEAAIKYCLEHLI